MTMFLPACALLLDFACFPIFCNMDNESLRQPLLLTDSTINGKIGKLLLKIVVAELMISYLICLVSKSCRLEELGVMILSVMYSDFSMKFSFIR